MLNKDGIRLNNEVFIDDDLLFVLNFAKTICILNKIDFPSSDLIAVKDMHNEVIETVKYNIDGLLVKTYEAYCYVAKTKSDGVDNTCDKFIRKFNECVDVLIECPKL